MASDKPTTSISAVDMTAQSISNYIAAGRFVAGQRLPEGDLAEQLGVGKNVVREAFARLQQDGILDIQRFRGAMVRRFCFEDAQEFLIVYAGLLGIAMREAAAKVARNPSFRAEVSRLREFLRDADPRSQAEHLDIFYTMHDDIIRLADNAYLTSILQKGTLVLFKRFIRESIPFCEEVVEHTKEIDRVLAFVECGDGERAYEALREWSKLERAWINPAALTSRT